MLVTWAISIGSLVWALRGYDFSQIKVAFLSVRWGWVLVAVMLELTVYVVQGWRWLTLLRPIERMGLWETVHAIYIGLFASGVLPLRPGEIIRGYLLAIWVRSLLADIDLDGHRARAPTASGWLPHSGSPRP
jgi:uncharacterized membrane protein YbhN (UPF0104 family)